MDSLACYTQTQTSTVQCTSHFHSKGNIPQQQASRKPVCDRFATGPRPELVTLLVRCIAGSISPLLILTLIDIYDSKMSVISTSISFTAALFGQLILWEAEIMFNIFCFRLWRPNDIVSIIHGIYTVALSALVMCATLPSLHCVLCSQWRKTDKFGLVTMHHTAKCDIKLCYLPVS